MKPLNILCLSILTLAIVSCGSKDNSSSVELVKSTDAVSGTTEENIVKNLQAEIVQYQRYPSLTLILMPKDNVQKSIKALVDGGAQLVYDPNNGTSSTIPFFIANLTADQINDSAFMNSLNLKAASIETNDSQIKPIKTKITTSDITPENFIPTESVGINALVNGSNTRDSLGENTVVAVIDTGVDASHPGFNGRVDYWYDASEEVQTTLQAVSLTQDNQISVNNRLFKLPVGVEKGQMFAASLNEKDLAAQLSGANKEKKAYLDVNLNGTNDDFLILAVKTDTGVKVYFDADADYVFSKKESQALIDYNTTQKNNRKMGMVEFPTRNSLVSYPVLIQEEKDSIIVGLGKTGGMHGTHVAGIIAANDPENNLVGAAPKAKIMALKVCTQISCTDSAIIKALYKSFYNKKGLIPDVVNISLGSHEKYRKGIYSHIIDDLSAKFGTIFFVSASNSGPGFRSLNHIGNTGAVVTVGANVSAKTLSDQYNLPAGSNTQDENLLFFSSLGPSYTSEMKPNIVAPGAAISTVLTAEGYLSQANGTSMSSPLAAGAMAAIIGSLKKEDNSLFKTINAQRKININRANKATRSLLPYVYGMRDALQKTALELEDLTLAQQGYGLIKVGPAMNSLRTILTDLNNKESNYFEVIINDYKKSYERGAHATRLKFGLTLGFDGERPLSEKAKILANGVDVELAKVEIIGTNGKVVKLNSTLNPSSEMTDFFHILDQGNINNKKLKTHVTFNNRRTRAFYSQRNLKKMNRGYTYIAHYKISYKGNTVQNILDVVHMPLVLKKRSVSVPAIDPSIKSVNKGLVKKNISISQNTFHRYPLMIDSKTQKINVKVAIKNNATGLLYVQLYDPTGKEASFKTAINEPINGYSQADIDVSTIKNGKVVSGIWELTISTSSSTWLSDSKYDLLVDTSSFGAVKNSYTLTKKNVLEVPIRLGGEKVSKVVIHPFNEIKSLSVKVKSGHFSFYPISSIKADTLKLKIEDKKGTYWGAISSKLFVKVDGEFKEFSGKYKSKSQGSTRVFSGLDTITNELYFALDTITNYDLGQTINSSRASSVEVQVLKKSEVEFKLEHSISTYADNDLSVLKITYPALLVDMEKVFSGKVSIFTGKTQEITTHSGETIINLEDDAKKDSFNLLIK